MIGAGNRFYISGNYVDVHDNENVNLTFDKGMLNVEQKPPKDSMEPDEPLSTPEDILNYVMRLHPFYVHKEWTDLYPALWERALELPGVKTVIYKPGKQRGTLFNRKLVANLLHLMCERGVLKATGTTMAEVLEGSKDASIRGSLGEMPSDRALVSEIGELISQMKKKIISK